MLFMKNGMDEDEKDGEGRAPVATPIIADSEMGLSRALSSTETLIILKCVHQE